MLSAPLSGQERRKVNGMNWFRETLQISSFTCVKRVTGRRLIISLLFSESQMNSAPSQVSLASSTIATEALL